MSGTYDLGRFFQTDHFTNDYLVSSPQHFVPALAGHHLDVLKTRFVELVSGEGKAEALWESWAFANVLGRQGIPNRVDSWGPDWPHDWMTWRKMAPKLLGEWVK
jgi:esterase/lipase superfamily enzyme